MLQVGLVAVFQIFALTAILVGLCAGAAPEKTGAATLIAMELLQISGHAVAPMHFNSTDIVVLAVDTFGLCGFGFLALTANRLWPIFAAALQLLSIAAHGTRAIDVKIEPFVYAIMNNAPTFLVLICLLFGTISYRKNLSRNGADRPWTDWSPQSRKVA